MVTNSKLTGNSDIMAPTKSQLIRILDISETILV